MNFKRQEVPSLTGNDMTALSLLLNFLLREFGVTLIGRLRTTLHFFPVYRQRLLDSPLSFTHYYLIIILPPDFKAKLRTVNLTEMTDSLAIGS